MMAVPVQLLIVDEHAQVRQAIAQRLRRLPGAIILGAVSDVATAVPLVRTLRPDVVLFEPKTSDGRRRHGLEPLLNAGSPVVVWTSSLEDDEADGYLRAGASAVLLKNTNMPELIRTLASIEA